MQNKEIRDKIKKILFEDFTKDEIKTFSLDINVKESDRKDIWLIRRELISRGYKLFIVGGAVRDAVKNAIKLQKNPQDTTLETPKDFDLVTDAHPEKIKEIFKDANFISNILNIGESFAIQFLVTKLGNQYELATFRSDAGGGRKPDSVKYETSPKEDSKRRDLTINALFYNIIGLAEGGFNGQVIDYVGGVEDIKNNVINTVGDPYDRFNEDPLRKIRAIRFASKMGSKIPTNVANAIKDRDTSLMDPTGKSVSKERIKDEFYKGIKSSKSIKFFLELLSEFDFFKHIFGKLNINKNYFIEEKHPIVLVANLLKDNNIKNIGNELNLLKYSGDEIKSIAFLVSLLNLNENTVSEIKKFYISKAKYSNPKIGETNFPMNNELIYKFALLSNIDKIKIDNFLRLANEFVQPTELLKSLGYQEKDLGMAISRLEKEFYKNPNKIKSILDSKNIEEITKLIFISK